jgi:hypothetical protein
VVFPFQTLWLEVFPLEALSIGKRSVVLWMIGIILLLGGALRLYKLDEKSLWSDEIATLATSSGHRIDPVGFQLQGQSFDPSWPVPAKVYQQNTLQKKTGTTWQQLSWALRANVHPPLFFAFMGQWLQRVGTTTFLIRLPAALFGILGIPLFFLLACKLARYDTQLNHSDTLMKGFALMSSFLFACSAYQVDHAQDARQYTLLIDIALLALLLVCQQIEHGFNEQTRSFPQHLKSCLQWIALVITLTAGLYTQYFFALFIAFTMLFLLVLQAKKTKGITRSFMLSWIGIVVGIAVLFLPWLGVFEAQSAFFKLGGHYTHGLWNPVQLPEKLWRIFCEFLMPGSPIGKILPLVALVGAFAPARWFNKPSGTTDFKPENSSWALSVVGLTLLWIGVIVAGQMLLDLIKDTHTTTIRRYLLLASPAWYLLVSFGSIRLWTLKPQKQLPQKYLQGYLPKYLKLPAWLSGIALPVILNVVLPVSVLTDTLIRLTTHHVSSDEFRQAAHWIVEETRRYQSIKPNEHVVLTHKSGAIAVGVAYYLPPEVLMRGLSIDAVQQLTGNPETVKLLNAMVVGTLAHPNPKLISLVFSHSSKSVQNGLTTYFIHQGYQMCETRKYPGVLTVQLAKSCRK